MNYPDLLTGKSTPAGTGINIRRGYERVFAATLTHESLSLVLPLLHLAHDPRHVAGVIDAFRDGGRVLSIGVGAGTLDAILPVLEAIAGSHEPVRPICTCDHLQRCGDHYRCLKCGNVVQAASDSCCLTST